MNRIKLPTYYIDDDKVHWIKQTKRGIKYFHTFRTYELSSDRNTPEHIEQFLTIAGGKKLPQRIIYRIKGFRANKHLFKAISGVNIRGEYIFRCIGDIINVINTMDSGQWELKNNYGTSGYLSIVGETSFCDLFSDDLIPEFLRRCHTKLNYVAIKKLCLYFKENCESSEWLDNFVMKNLKPEDQILYFINM